MTGVRNKIIYVADRALTAVAVIAGILILLISVYSILDNIWQYQGAVDDTLLSYKPKLDEPYDTSAIITEDQVAWLCIDDTRIDHPVMQGEDNYEYLSKDPYGEYRLSGAVFLDCRNDRNFQDEYSILYGHHMEHGAMFGALDDFRDRAYFDAHRTGRLVTQDAVYELTIFAVSGANAADRTVFDPVGRTKEEILDFLKENAVIFEGPAEGERFLALSTCSADENADRLIVIAAMKEK